MLSLRLLCVILSVISSVFGSVGIDKQCFDNCSCCKDNKCGLGINNWTNVCKKGCIDRHRGARCSELCQYANCRSCGGTGDSRLCEICYDGYYLGPRRDCTLQCPPNCKSCTLETKCIACKEGFYNKDDSSTCTYAHCPKNCKCTEQGDCVSCKMGFYDTSASCKKRCPVNCLSCESDNSCNECKNGFYNGYEYGNNTIHHSKTCTYTCRESCTQCQSYEKCLQCIKGKYGSTCQEKCSIGCKSKTCSIDFGKCECTNSFTGDKCMECADGKYGSTCTHLCSKYCKDRICERTSGDCIDGCINANISGVNCNLCIVGMHGEFCGMVCPKNCRQSSCERYRGTCNEGCVRNFNGTKCDICIPGKYGVNCEQECPVNCFGNTCERILGTCNECIGNFDGKRCDECKSGFYGLNCNKSCSLNCANSICNRDNGTCINGCLDGFSGDKCCVISKNCYECYNNSKCESCVSGYYQMSCSESCPEGCLGSCNISTGECRNCQNKRFGRFCGMTCSENCNDETSIDNRTCAKSDGKCYGCHDGYFSRICNATCSSLCVGGICRQDDGICINGCEDRLEQPECVLSEGQTGETGNLTIPISGGVVALLIVVAGIAFSAFHFRRRRTQKDSRNENMANSALSSNRSAERAYTVKEGPVYANIREKRALDADFEDVVFDETNDNELDNGAGYYGCDSVNVKVKVADLFSFVTKDNLDIFDKEFKNLPKPGDLSALCKVAKRPENIALNRYNGVYPFDHTRVIIPGQPKYFINASYIDGYNRSKTYIASLGPTFKHTENFTTFWRMVWQCKSDIIVMLTNLLEASGMKCDQYWPEVDTEESYGHIKVKCQGIEEFAEYTVRCFTVSKGKEHRNLTQLHFTAWPDKGVPSEVTSLVEFRQRVKAAPVVLDGPVIVHCSAGVGRTGTYIALDILSEQGKAEGFVNVFDCVSKMREQRVNMVQTAKQYIFLYKALVHTLTFGCESQTAEEIQSLAFDANRRFMSMFQTLKQEVDHEGEQDIADREENRRNYPDKSRRNSDIPGHRARVRLYLHRKSGNHDFINAVFIDSFKMKDLFIAAQTPQTDTVEDFLCMLYQQNSSCVVALEDQQQLSRKHDIGIYLPADYETYKCGAFTVTSLKCESKSQYTVKKLTIKHTDKGEEKVAYNFQYTRWGNGQKIADNPGDFVQFVKDVEKYVKQRDVPNLVVHCLNGYERSGLFCVVYTLLEKLEAERQVSVVNVIRKVRAQRKLSITSVEQLKFCYQCISAYLESYNTYTNY